MNRSGWCLHLLTLCATVIGTLGVVYGASASDIAHRRVVFENDHVRVNELFASPGAEAPMHLQRPGLLISLSKARFEMKAPDGEVTLVDYFPGQVLWKGESDRRSWKLLAGDAHVFFVEVTSAASGTTPEPAPLDVRDSTLLEPEQHNVIIDNEHVRVIDGMAASGSRSIPHTHPPSVLVSLAKSRFKVTINGKTRIFDFEPFMVRWTNHFEHTWEILAGDARVIVVEIKSAHSAPEFKRRT